ncbi:MAG: DUF397 domain-containing protein [Streptosporangiaceae bacterium]
MRPGGLASVVWRKSNRSNSSGGDCVEVAGLSSAIAVRDSKHPDGPHLAFARAAFTALAREIRAGRHDL